VDSVALIDGTTEKGLLSRADLDAVYDVIAAGVAREVSAGDMPSFATAQDDATCKYCPFTTICPGAGTVAAERDDAMERSTFTVDRRGPA